MLEWKLVKGNFWEIFILKWICVEVWVSFLYCMCWNMVRVRNIFLVIDFVKFFLKLFVLGRKYYFWGYFENYFWCLEVKKVW